MKTKQSAHKSCLIKLPRADTVSEASSAIAAISLSQPTAADQPEHTQQSPPSAGVGKRLSRKRAASQELATPLLPATTTRCLSLSQFLTLLVQQQNQQQSQQQSQQQHSQLAQGVQQGTSGDHADLGVEDFAGTTGTSASSAVGALSALERRLLSLTISDAGALRSSELLTDNVLLPSFAADSPVLVQRTTSGELETTDYVVL